MTTVLERRVFGRSGHESSRVIFGAAALSAVDQEKADALLPVLDRHGVNHLDVAANYGDAELRLAPWLAGRRADFFLATKTEERTAAGARASLERSLERLGVDEVDLIQLHNLVEGDEWETAHGPGGALEALVAAREEGLVRLIGVTGHGLRIAGMHRRSLSRYDYDSVLLPCNSALLADPGYRADLEDLLELCAERTVAVQLIKAVARRRWTEPAGPGEERHSWYEPLTDRAAIGRAVRYVLSIGQAFLVSSSEFTILEAILEEAEGGVPPGGEELENDRSAYGVTPLFDGAELERI